MKINHMVLPKRSIKSTCLNLYPLMMFFKKFLSKIEMEENFFNQINDINFFLKNVCN